MAPLLSGVTFSTRKKKKFRIPSLKSFKIKPGKRTIYSDLISVMGSQIRYNKATSPTLTPKLWEKYGSNVFGYFPTLEQLNAKKSSSFRPQRMKTGVMKGFMKKFKRGI